MSRYIDVKDILAGKFVALVEGEHRMYQMGWNDALDSVANYAPTADVRENVKGEWQQMKNIYDDCTWICSVCGEPFILIEGEPAQNNYNYCPSCGADMRGEQNE